MKKFFKVRKNNGYTILELVVVFTIAATLAGIGIGAYSTYNKTQQLSQSALNAQQLVNQARGNALSVVKKTRNQSGVAITCSPATNVLIGYYVISPDNKTLQLFHECVDVVGNPSQKNLVKSVVLQGDVVITSFSCPAIRYESLTAKLLDNTYQNNNRYNNINTTILPYGYVNTSCDIVLSDGTRTKTIRIDPGGNTTLQ